MLRLQLEQVWRLSELDSFCYLEERKQIDNREIEKGLPIKVILFVYYEIVAFSFFHERPNPVKPTIIVTIGQAKQKIANGT